MNLEGTPEFNRGFRSRTELQGEYIEPEWQQELDEYSREYHPFQEIVEDTQVGFDAEGNYHAVYEGLGRAITPYRWASYLEDAVVQFASTQDYHMGFSERADLAQSIVQDRISRAVDKNEIMNLQDAFQVWCRSYGL